MECIIASLIQNVKIVLTLNKSFSLKQYDDTYTINENL